MAMPPYTRRTLIARLKKQIANGFPNDDFPITDKEMNLYIDQVLAAAIPGQVYGQAKVTGMLEASDGFYMTFTFASGPSYDDNRNDWWLTLPETPLSLPLGINVRRVYAASSLFGGETESFRLITGQRKAYRGQLPRPDGVEASFENAIMRMKMSDGGSLLGVPIYVEMISVRATDLDTVLNIPTDIIDVVWDKVFANMFKRYMTPQDIIADNLPAGNKSS